MCDYDKRTALHLAASNGTYKGARVQGRREGGAKQKRALAPFVISLACVHVRPTGVHHAGWQRELCELCDTVGLRARTEGPRGGASCTRAGRQT